MTHDISPKQGGLCAAGALPADEIIHLPVAPRSTTRTRFSAPPDHSRCLAVTEALELLERRMEEKNGRISMVALCGPGDPLATPDITFEVMHGIRRRFGELPIGMLTAGIGSGGLAGDLARSGLGYVEMNVEGVRREILEKLFAWIRPGSRTVQLREAAELLLQEQRSGVSALKFHGIAVSIQTTLYPGLNIDHVAKISGEMMELGADSISLTPYSPEPGAEVDLEPPSAKAVAEAICRAEANLPVVRALLYGQNNKRPKNDSPNNILTGRPTAKRPNAAVVSSNGIEVDLHLGHAIRFLIYGRRGDGLTCLLETRDAPEPGSGDERWRKVADILGDCFLLMAAGAGEKPRGILGKHGLRVLLTEENIEGLVDVLYGGGKKRKK
jgi:nitrogen fixation protein NifB